MLVMVRRWEILGIAALASVWLSGCGTPVNRAPVENRGTYAARPAPTPTGGITTPPTTSAPAEEPSPSSLGLENEGRPGYYTVRPGDTLIGIGLETGQYWKDLAQWNNLENPDLLRIGQVVRVVPPVALAEGTTTTQPTSPTGVVAAPVKTPQVTPSTPKVSDTAEAKPTTPPTPEKKPASPPPASSSGGILFAWPASGPIIAKFHAEKNKGIGIGGQAGDPVLAAADGRVVYAGSQLRGYGNLIIIKHSDTYLTAYAHNEKLLVKEEQNVKLGQKIAEMGKTDSDRVKLHFEIRQKGVPTDPTRFLPKR